MNWIKFECKKLLAPEYRLTPGDVRANHMTLLAQCAVLENGGRYLNAKRWKIDQWIHFCLLTKPQVMALISYALARYERSDLVVSDYDLAGEALVKTRSEIGRKGAISRWKLMKTGKLLIKKRSALQDGKGNGKGISKGIGKGIGKGNGKGNGKGIWQRHPKTMHVRSRPFVRSGSDDPERTHGLRPNPKSPSLEGRGLLSSAIEQIKSAWPWPESFVPEAVKRSLNRYGRDRIDEIIAGMKRDTANPKWRQKNLMVRAASYIRGGQWLLEPKIAAPKNGASNHKPAKKDPNRAAQELAELDELARDFSEAFPGEPFPGREKAWKMVKTAKVEKLANAKS